MSTTRIISPGKLLRMIEKLDTRSESYDLVFPDLVAILGQDEPVKYIGPLEHILKERRFSSTETDTVVEMGLSAFRDAPALLKRLGQALVETGYRPQRRLFETDPYMVERHGKWLVLMGFVPPDDSRVPGIAPRRLRARMETLLESGLPLTSLRPIILHAVRSEPRRAYGDIAHLSLRHLDSLGEAQDAFVETVLWSYRHYPALFQRLCTVLLLSGYRPDNPLFANRPEMGEMHGARLVLAGLVPPDMPGSPAISARKLKAHMNYLLDREMTLDTVQDTVLHAVRSDRRRHYIHAAELSLQNLDRLSGNPDSMVEDILWAYRDFPALLQRLCEILLKIGYEPSSPLFDGGLEELGSTSVATLLYYGFAEVGNRQPEPGILRRLVGIAENDVDGESLHQKHVPDLFGAMFASQNILVQRRVLRRPLFREHMNHPRVRDIVAAIVEAVSDSPASLREVASAFGGSGITFTNAERFPSAAGLANAHDPSIAAIGARRPGADDIAAVKRLHGKYSRSPNASNHKRLVNWYDQYWCQGWHGDTYSLPVFFETLLAQPVQFRSLSTRILEGVSDLPESPRFALVRYIRAAIRKSDFTLHDPDIPRLAAEGLERSSALLSLMKTTSRTLPGPDVEIHAEKARALASDSHKRGAVIVLLSSQKRVIPDELVAMAENPRILTIAGRLMQQKTNESKGPQSHVAGELFWYSEDGRQIYADLFAKVQEFSAGLKNGLQPRPDDMDAANILMMDRMYSDLFCLHHLRKALRRWTRHVVVLSDNRKFVRLVRQTLEAAGSRAEVVSPLVDSNATVLRKARFPTAQMLSALRPAGKSRALPAKRHTHGGVKTAPGTFISGPINKPAHRAALVNVAAAAARDGDVRILLTSGVSKKGIANIQDDIAERLGLEDASQTRCTLHEVKSLLRSFRWDEPQCRQFYQTVHALRAMRSAWRDDKVMLDYLSEFYLGHVWQLQTALRDGLERIAPISTRAAIVFLARTFYGCAVNAFMQARGVTTVDTHVVTIADSARQLLAETDLYAVIDSEQKRFVVDYYGIDPLRIRPVGYLANSPTTDVTTASNDEEPVFPILSALGSHEGDGIFIATQPSPAHLNFGMIEAVVEATRLKGKGLVVLKPHPRETAEALESYRAYVNRGREGVTLMFAEQDVPVDALIRLSDFTVTRTSNVAIEAAMLGKPAIRYIANETILPAPFRTLPYALNVTDGECGVETLLEFFSRGDLFRSIERQRKRYLEDNPALTCNDGADRLMQFIAEHLNAKESQGRKTTRKRKGRGGLLIGSYDVRQRDRIREETDPKTREHSEEA